MTSRPTRTTNPTSRLLDPNNIGAPAISSHRQAVADAAAAKVRADAQAMLLENPENFSRASSTLSITEPPPSTLSSRQPSPGPVNKRPRASEPATGPENKSDHDSSEDASGTDTSAKTKKKPTKKRRKKAQKSKGESDFLNTWYIYNKNIYFSSCGCGLSCRRGWNAQ